MAGLHFRSRTDGRSLKHMRTLTLLVLIACAQTDRVEPASRRPSEPAVEKNIYIDEVTAENPVTIRGRARTFENSVVLRVRDERDAVIVEDFTTSAGEIGHHNPFTADIWLTRHPGRQITVEAFEYSAKDGAIRSLEKKTVPFTVEPTAVNLVLPAADCTKFEEVERIVPKTPAMARVLVEALLAEPSSPFPRGSEVKSINLRDGVLTVDFNERLQNVGGSCTATAIRESVTRTLRTLKNVQRVVITAGGSETLALQP